MAEPQRDTVGTQRDTFGTLKVAQPQRDTVGTQRDVLETLKVAQPQRDTAGTQRDSGDPKGHIWDPEGGTAPKGHSGDPKGVTAPKEHSGDPKGVTTPKGHAPGCHQGTRWGPTGCPSPTEGRGCAVRCHPPIQVTPRHPPRCNIPKGRTGTPRGTTFTRDVPPPPPPQQPPQVPEVSPAVSPPPFRTPLRGRRSLNRPQTSS